MDDKHKRKEPADTAAIHSALLMWEQASVTVMDVRRKLIHKDEAIREYLMPTSTFVYTAGGSGQVHLDDTAFLTERFGLFHGGKGTRLSIAPMTDSLECYMVLYKAKPQRFPIRGLSRLPDHSSPFEDQYGYSANHPIFFMEHLKRMYDGWKSPTPLRRFFVKSAFYQLVYGMFREISSGEIGILKPDIVAMAQRYLSEHYHEALSIQSLSEGLGVSGSHLHRLFKQQTGKSPQEYLTSLRMDSAKHYLRSSEYSLRDIANATGFYDEYHLSNAFKKHEGVAPGGYREMFASGMSDLSIGEDFPIPYTDERMVSHFEIQDKGAYYMRHKIKSSFILTAVLSLMLLSACGGGTGGNSASPASSASASPAAAGEQASAKPEAAQAAEGATRTVHTELGDVEVPMNPKRVVVQYFMGEVLALGITPVGITNVMKGAAFEDEVKDSAKLGTWYTEWKPEEVMALDPDLIIVMFKEEYDKYSKIAPTVYVPYDNEISTEERMAFFGQILNKEDEANKNIENLHEKLEESKRRLADAGLGDSTVSLLTGDGKKMWVGSNKYALGEILYSKLSLQPPTAVQKDIIDNNEVWSEVSMEVLPNYIGDYLFFTSQTETNETMSNNKVWSSLPAVKNKHVIEMDYGLAYYNDVYSTSAQIDYVVNALVGAAGNNQ